jgi:phosphoribosyl 1,2-cyclic phosphodiesterase
MLGSGSSGNAVLVECEGSRILVDAGFGTRTLSGRLRAIGVDPRSIEACFVTHEHNDHVQGAGRGAKRWGWTVYATPGTAQAPELAETRVRRFKSGASIDLDRMTVESTRTPHDAMESVGFVVTSRSTGARAAIFYDIGHASEAIATACRDADILLIESNHDDDMLRHGPYPRWLQARIASPVGHLSNRCAAQLARRVVSRQVNHLVLSHLSERCNRPYIALKSMTEALNRSRFRGTVTAAVQDGVVGPFTPSASRAEAPLQYELL